MGKFILRILIFLIPLLMILTALEYIAQSSPNSYRYKNDYIANNCDSVNTLILGSSHTFYGINPEILGNNSFNLANVSQDLKFDLYLLEKSIAQCKNLKTLIVPISYFTLYETPLDKGNEKFRVKFYEHYMGYDDSLLNCIEKLELYNPAILQTKIKDYCKLHFGTDEDFGYNSLGWATGYKECMIDGNIEKDAIKTIARHTPSEEYVDINIENLNKIATLCYKNNIRLFFITTPTLPAYYNKIKNERWSYTTSVINNICLKYKASYYSYLNDERFDTSDFFDIDHLCHKGAEKFSTILKEEIFE